MATTTDKVYEWVTERIVALLEAGTIPWHCPWIMGGAPMNFISKKPYRGLNVFMLASMGYASPYWLTRNQILGKGGRFRKGERSSMIVFWKFGKRKKDGVVLLDDKGKPQTSAILRYYNVWNVEQIDGIEYPKPETTVHDPIAECEAVISGFETCPPITHEGGRAFYRESTDSITMPPMEYFNVTAEYYSTLFHEAAHSTGHPTRLGRNLSGGRGSESYSFEELVAEMTAAMLCGKAGIEMQTLENSAAYIANWLQRFKSDTKMAVKAAGKAQKAADCITGYSYKSDTDATLEPERERLAVA